ncbi:hypothetical protein BH09MYX1_BH09MYX1_02540 [soil metagenome]
MTDEPAPDAPEKIYEWHRAEGAGGVLKPLGMGMAIVFCAPIFGALGFLVFRDQNALRYVMTGLTLACAPIGPAVAVIGLQRNLRDEAFLAARTSGVLYERNGRAVTLLWATLTKIEYVAPDMLVFHRRDEDSFTVPERYGTITVEELAKRLEELRRKSAFFLLPGQVAPKTPPEATS